MTLPAKTYPNTKSALPFSGGFAPHTGGMIKKLIFHECSISAQMYIETFIPCLIRMVITIVTWDIEDIIRNAGESIAEPNFKRGRGGKGHTKRGRVGSRVSPAQGKTSNGLNHVLKWTAPLERLGYLVLLYNATERFSATWMQLLHIDHCGKPESQGPLQRHCDEKAQAATGTFNSLNLDHLDQNRAGWPTTGFTAHVPFGWYSITFEASIRANPSNEWWAQVVVQANPSLLIGDAESEPIFSQGPGTLHCMLHVDVFCPFITGMEIVWGTRVAPIPVGCVIEEASVSIFNFDAGKR